MAWLGGWNTWFQETFVAPPPAAENPSEQGSNGGYSSSAFGGASGSTGAPRQDYDQGRRTSNSKHLPPVIDTGVAATEVATLAQKRLKEAWTAFGDEFAVQLRVWESCSLAFKKSATEAAQAKRSNLQRAVDDALAASKRDPTGAVKMIRPLLEGLRPKGEDDKQGLNSATEAAAQNVVKAERQCQHCKKLATILRNPETSRSQDELETLVKACRLSNSNLESRIRQALGMAKSKEEQKKEAKEALDMERKAMKALIAQLADASGTSHDNAKRALDNAGGDPDLALVMLLSDPDEAAKRAKREAKAAKGKDDKKPTAESKKQAAKDAEQARKDRLAEAKQVVHAIKSLASSTQRMAWAQVQLELETQVNVWQTQAVLGASTGRSSVDYGDTQCEIQSVLAEAARDPVNAVFLLEVALQNALDYGLDLSTGILVAADGVLEAESVAKNRRTLAARLHDVLRSMETDRDAILRKWQPQETEELIAACKLKDASMEIRARMMLDSRNVSL